MSQHTQTSLEETPIRDTSLYPSSWKATQSHASLDTIADSAGQRVSPLASFTWQCLDTSHSAPVLYLCDDRSLAIGCVLGDLSPSRRSN